jgi:hypothetical protein
MIVKGRMAFAFFALYATIAIFCVRFCRASAVESNESWGRFSSSEIVSRSEKLIRSLRANRDANQYSAQAEASRIFSGSIRNHWIVECRDKEGVYLGNMDWDADTGELNSISNDLQISSPSDGAELTSQAAIKIARNWLLRTGLCNKKEAWTLDRATEINSFSWLVHFRDGKRIASISIDLYSGHLIRLVVYPLPAAGSISRRDESAGSLTPADSISAGVFLYETSASQAKRVAK